MSVRYAWLFVLSGGLLVSGIIGVGSFFGEKRTDTNNPSG